MKVLRSTVAFSAIAAAMLSTNASAVNIATEGVGEVAIAPYYTTREGWQSTINLINTQDRPVAVKVRFHEALNSRDVLDFTVLLSAFDVFTGVVRANADGAPVFVNADQANAAGKYTCTVPNTRASNGTGAAFEINLRPLGFSGSESGDSNADGGLGSDAGGALTTASKSRLSEGYIEFIVMGYADPNWGIDDSVNPVVGVPIDSAGYAALSASQKLRFIGRAIEDHDCATLQTAFTNGTGGTTILRTARQFGEPISALKFNFTLLNPARGTETGYSATTWANFYNPGGVRTQTGANDPGSGITTGTGQFAALVIPEDNYNCDLDRGVERRTLWNGTTGTNWCPNGLSGNTCAAGNITVNPTTLTTKTLNNVNNGAAGDNTTVESCRNLITAQQVQTFLEPTLNDAFPQTAYLIEDKNGEAGNYWHDATLEPDATYYATASAAVVEDVRGVDAVSLTIQRATAINDWSTNPALGVSTDWIVTQPTKAFYVDQSRSDQAQVIVDNVALPTTGIKGRAEAYLPNAGPNTDTGFDNTGVVPYPPYQAKFTGTVPNGSSCSTIGFAVYDRAEQSGATPPEEPEFSPALPAATVTNALCYETNVISFTDSTGTLRTALGNDGGNLIKNRVTVNTTQVLANPSDFGWMLLQLDAFGSDLQGAAMPAFDQENYGAVTLRGLPVIGFNIRTRNFPNRPDLSFSSSADHGYIRSYVTGVGVP
ncbi:hypothetical protein AAG565_03330 [Fontimonas sp. SYSU GA230001]|uniref:hypothetical protein n=1 Tax=Fontimonas sp. SYSU GA230001 TaxID=3142450 RepID=UPI0032B4FC25